ncbi:hypothetical protein HPB47_012216 [Ixodes persulcatus]|uniref:Uncharacterized protein n=1 Tax=Ixodes persulcatus TaxID=34615 RepID=A0AC60NUA1_IXOPE|nr:hypothetical protein HPB47_012216 [Ixodes persulcatus]
MRSGDDAIHCVRKALARSLTKRWKNQRLNRKLKIKIQKISHKAEEHAAELTRQNWYNLCDSVQGRLSSASTWKLLRALLDPNHTRTVTCKRISELVFKGPLTTHAMFDKLASKYLCIEPSEAQKDYHGRANPALDEPITTAAFNALPKSQNCWCSRTRTADNPAPADLNIYIDGQEVPKPKEVRILGQILTQSGRNLSTINKPRRTLTQTEVNKLNVIIRRAFKCALGLPEYVATEDLLSTGLYNTIEEL